MSDTSTFVIKGMGGQRKLKGRIRVDYSKNTALAVLCTLPLFETPVRFQNITEYKDITTLLTILEDIGVSVVREKDCLVCTPSKVLSNKLVDGVVNSIRASIQLTGPLLAYFSAVTFLRPGGCDIGIRKIDFFTDLYTKMGAVCTENKDTVRCEVDDKLIGTNYQFPRSSVGGTITAATTAILAKGKTVLKNCALEPDVLYVLNFLKESGAEIEGIGTRTLTITGRGGKLLRANKAFENPPDRIQAGEYLLLGASLAEELIIENFRVEDAREILTLIDNISQMDVITEKDKVFLKFNPNKQLDNTPIKIITKEYPGFPTDLQTMFVVFATTLNREITVEETIFEDRMKGQLQPFIDMHIPIELIGNAECVIRGPAQLQPLNINSQDLRTGMANILAALLAEGESRISNINLIDRGHLYIERVLSSVGACIKRQ